jgi:class 3 adenylate cyclase
LKTLRSKFLVFILVPVITVLLALSVLSYFSARDLLIAQIREGGITALQASAEKLSVSIVQIHSMLRLVSLSENLEEKSDSYRQRLFVRLTEVPDDAITSVFMGFPDGKFIRGKTDPLPELFDPRKRPWYTAALNFPPGKMEGATEPYLDASTKRPVITLYRKVLKRDGSLMGVLGVDVDVILGSQAITKEIELPPGGHMILVTNSGTILLHPDEEAIGLDLGYTGESLDIKVSGDIKNPEVPFIQYIDKRFGEKWYVGFHRVPAAGSSIVVMFPMERVPKPLRLLALQMIAVASPFLIGILVLLLVIIKKVSQPVVDLTNSAVKIAKEDSYHNPLEVKSSDEVGRLTEAFNTMMEGLRQRDFIRDIFGRYVTKEVVEELLGSPDGLKLGGEKREVTIMFSDLRGFTPLSEHLSPDQIIGLLNRFLGKMADIISSYKGTVNEFVGDAVLAFFGAPVKRQDSPARAVACSLAMQLAMEDINRQNKEQGLPSVSMGIGVNTGEVIVGNIGSEKRVKYGVVGHHINLTSRVQDATVGGQILITPSTYEQVKDIVLIRSSRSINFKGVDEGVTVYEVAGIKGPYNLTLPEETRDAKPLENPLAVNVFKMTGKRVEGSPLAGHLTHISAPWARANLPEQIKLSSEIRLDIPVPGRSESERIYAKVVEVADKGDSYDHLVRISYLTPALTTVIDMGS